MNWIKSKIRWILVILGLVSFASVAPLLIPDPSSIEVTQIETAFAGSDIAEDYTLEGTTFTKPAIDENSIKIKLGKDNTDEFTPDFYISRWEDEVYFKMSPRDLDKVAKKDKSLKFENKKIKFEAPKIDFEMYSYEGGYKYVWYLNEKPTTNKIEFDIETEGLNFFYQPPLDEEYDDSTCTPIDCQNSHRPENVVGSYAVYHSTKANHIIGQKNYMAGKAFHIYRPLLIDADGNETWGILHIENDIYSVGIPQDFLDNAVYPIKSNDNFGYYNDGTPGETSYQTLSDQLNGTVFTAPAGGTATHMGYYTYQGTYDDGPLKLGLYAEGGTGGDACVFLKGTAEQTSPDTNAWNEYALTSTETITESTEYVMVHWGEEVSMVHDLVADTGRQNFSAPYPDDWPTPADISAGEGNKHFSIYVAYTPDAPPAAAPPAVQEFWVE